MRTLKFNRHSLIDASIYFLVALVSLFFLTSLDYSNTNVLTVVGFSLIGIISFLMIVTDKYNISIRRTIYIFCYIFFFIAPLQQYTEGAILWKHTGLRVSYSNADYNKAILAILLMMLLFEIGYRKKEKNRKSNAKEIIQKPYIQNENFIILVIISTIAFFVLFATNNIKDFNNVFGSAAVGNQMVNILKYLPVCSLMVGLMCAQRYGMRGNSFLLFIIAAESIYLFFPLWGSMARYILLGTYVVFYAFFFRKAKYKSIYFLAFFLGFCFSFTNSKYVTDMESLFNSISINFNHVDYDAFQILMSSMKYVEQEGALYFVNILSAMAFLLPRAIWAGKLEGSGTIVVRYFNSRQENVSAPMVAEFYLAAGWIGVIVLSCILGCIVKRLDEFQLSESYLKQAVFCIITGMTVYIQRGSLLAAFAFTGGLLLSLFCVYFLCVIKYK